MGYLIASVLTLVPAFAVLQEPAPESPITTVSATQPVSEPGTPVWLLSRSVYREGINDEADHLRWVRGQRDKYVTLHEHCFGRPSGYEPAIVNWVLAREIEPAASRLLLGISRAEDAEHVRAALASVRKHQSPEEVSRTQTDLDTLQSFAAALEAVWVSEEDEKAIQARRNGVIALAVLLEHEREDVASAALLWQAMLYRQMGRLDKAFRLLPPVGERVDRDGRAYQFFARLLRCRLVAERGGHAAACALLLQVEERILEWFETDESRAEATRAALLVRLQILEQWRGAMDPKTEPGEIEWCAKAMERIRRTLAGEGDEIRVLRLGQTIPLIATMPEVQHAPPPHAG